MYSASSVYEAFGRRMLLSLLCWVFKMEEVDELVVSAGVETLSRNASVDPLFLPSHTDVRLPPHSQAGGHKTGRRSRRSLLYTLQTSWRTQTSPWRETVAPRYDTQPSLRNLRHLTTSHARPSPQSSVLPVLPGLPVRSAIWGGVCSRRRRAAHRRRSAETRRNSAQHPSSISSMDCDLPSRKNSARAHLGATLNLLTSESTTRTLPLGQQLNDFAELHRTRACGWFCNTGEVKHAG